jgi:hypothetical protein
MPINCNVTVPSEEVDPVEALRAYLLAGGKLPGYRFTGYTLNVDSDGNIHFNRPYSSQPAFWAYRAISYSNTDMR